MRKELTRIIKLKFVLLSSATVRSSSSASMVFEEEALPAVAHLTPIRENDTRWEGFFRAVDRFVLIKDSWKTFAADPDVSVKLAPSMSK